MISIFLALIGVLLLLSARHLRRTYQRRAIRRRLYLVCRRSA